MSPLAQDLREWRLASGRPGDGDLVFPRPDGGPWRDTDYRNWRKRTFAPAAGDAGLALRPYDLRHSFVSLLIREGQSIVEVARQAGHSPAVCLSTYAHVFDEFDPTTVYPLRTKSTGRVVSVCPLGTSPPAVSGGTDAQFGLLERSRRGDSNP